MLGAIIGDTVGSVYEFNNIKTTNFPLFGPQSNYTDDSIMTMAVAEWLLTDPQHGMDTLEASFLGFAKKYPSPMGGYGPGFCRWLFEPETFEDGKRHPYNSFGNGAAMRCSANGWIRPDKHHHQTGQCIHTEGMGEHIHHKTREEADKVLYRKRQLKRQHQKGQQIKGRRGEAEQVDVVADKHLQHNHQQETQYVGDYVIQGGNINPIRF